MSYIIWDFDNTLAHRPGLWGQCLADAANSALPGARLTRDQFRQYLSNGFPWHTPEREHHHLSDPDTWWSSLFPIFAAAVEAEAGVDSISASKIATQVRAEYLDPKHWVVFPDTEYTLAALSGRGWRHMVLSNHVPELPQLINLLGLSHHFQHVITSATLGYEKPHPSAFKAAMEAIPPGTRIIMIGDSFTADYGGARAVGLDAILVRGSHPDCDAAFPDLFTLLDHLNAD